MGVCVGVCERERDRESVCVCEGRVNYLFVHTHLVYSLSHPLEAMMAQLPILREWVERVQRAEGIIRGCARGWTEGEGMLGGWVDRVGCHGGLRGCSMNGYVGRACGCVCIGRAY